MRAEGIVGAAELVERRWTVAGARDAWIDAMTTAGPQPLVVETRYDGGLLRHLPARVGCSACCVHGGTERLRYWLAGDRRPRRWASRTSAPIVSAARPMARFSAAWTTAHGRASSGSTLATARSRRSARLEGRFIAKT